MKFKKSLLGSMISMAVTTSVLSTAALAQQVYTNDLSQLKQSGTVQSVKKSSGVYIVQLKDASGISYAESIGELLPSNQVVAQGNRYNAQSANMRAYAAQMKAKQQQIAQEVGVTDVLHNYVHTFNGFAAKLSPEQAKALEANANVAGVWQDELFKPQTSNTPAFLGLTGPGGQHSLDIKGEGVIVGILDTGITPENPSFADDGSYSDPAELGWTGSCDAGEETDAGTFSCNNKLIGARYYKDTFESQYEIQTGLGEFISPRDADGHGSHTAGTAAGNEGVVAEMFGTEIGTISGIAPRARVAMYKVCWNSDYVSPEGNDEAGCFYGDSMAAIDQAIADGVDVINYSIGGSRTDLTTPSTAAMLRAADAGVFVSVSAGNSGPTAVTVGTPAPWVASVGASTYDGISATNAIELTSRDPLEQVPFVEGAITAPLIETGDKAGQLVIAEPLQGCFVDGASAPLDNAEAINGNIALIQRGTCAFTEKVERAQLAGAAAVIIYSDGRPVTALGGDGSYDIPGGMIDTAAGDALNAAITGGEEITVRMSASIFTTQEETGNMMAGFSSRGPNGSTLDVIKPDITAPGVRILAATSSTPMFGPQGEQVKYLNGTSMSSPHIAGMAALLKGQHPDWSPAQIKSALMTTAYQGVTKEDGTTPADPFDFGAGHANPVPAMAPGLTYDANLGDYMAFMCGLGEDSFVEGSTGVTCADLEGAGFSTDPSQLNYPSIAIGKLTEQETIYRTLTDVSGIGGDYTVALEGLEGLTASTKTYDADGVETESANLVVDANGTASFSVTFAKTEETVVNEWVFGAVVLTGTDGTVVRSPIAVMPAPDVKIEVPESLSLDLNRGRATFPVKMLYSGSTSLSYAGLVAPFGTEGEVAQDPDQSFSFNEAGLSTNFYHIPEGTKVARFSLRDSLVAQPGSDLDLYVYRCTGWSCAQVATSTNGGSNEDVILVNPEPRANIGAGDVYLVWVHGWSLAGADTTTFTMPVWVADSEGAETRIVASPRAIDGRYNNVRVMTSGLDADYLYMGAITFYDDEGNEAGTTVLEVQP